MKGKSRKSKLKKMLKARDRNARSTTNTFRHVAASKWTLEDHKRYMSKKLGTFGAASPVRILMKDGIPVAQDAETSER